MVRMFVSLVRAPSISTHDPLSFLKAEMPSEPLVQVHYLYRYVATRTDSLSSSDTTAGSQKKFPLLHLFPKTMRQHWSSRMTQCSASYWFQVSHRPHTHTLIVVLYTSIPHYLNISITKHLNVSVPQHLSSQYFNVSIPQHINIEPSQYINILISQQLNILTS